VEQFSRIALRIRGGNAMFGAPTYKLITDASDSLAIAGKPTND